MQILFKADQVEKARGVTKINSGQFLTLPAPWSSPSFCTREEGTFDPQSDWGGGSQLSLYPPTLRSLQGNPQVPRGWPRALSSPLPKPRCRASVDSTELNDSPHKELESWSLVPEYVTLSSGAQSLSSVQLLVTLSRARVFTEVITSKQGHWGEL